MYKSFLSLLFFLGLLLFFTPLHAGDSNEILEQEADGMRKIVDQANRGRAHDAYSAPESFFILEGCYGGKKGEEFSNSAVNVKALYYSELFRRNTNKVTRVHLAFTKPVPLGVAQNYVGDFEPFLRGRNPTQKQNLTPKEADECTPKNGGIEYRFTRDYFIEFYYAPGGSRLIQEARFWNGNYNN